jgi:hypothetical protein
MSPFQERANEVFYDDVMASKSAQNCIYLYLYIYIYIYRERESVVKQMKKIQSQYITIKQYYNGTIILYNITINY